MQPTNYPTLVQSLWPTSPNLLRPVALVLLGTMALAISAKVQVPFYPVPMTMQTLVVLILSAIFGARLGSLTVGVYLMEGALGLPVFASGAGLSYLVGPTAGFLVGFLAAAAGVGYAAEKGFDRSFVASFAVMSLGHVIIFCFGFAWLSALFGPAKAWSVGVAPFIAATVLKTAIAALFVPALWRLNAPLKRIG
jgi:biotin transport system substrate-specific component